MTEALRRAGRRAQWLVRALMVLTPVLVATQLLAQGSWALVRVPAAYLPQSGALSRAGQMGGIALGVVEPAAWWLGLFFLNRLFGLYARGEVFTAQNVATIRRIGWVLVSIDAVRMGMAALAGPILTLTGDVQGLISVELQLSLAIVGVFVLLIARVMDMGTELLEADRLTI